MKFSEAYRKQLDSVRFSEDFALRALSAMERAEQTPDVSKEKSNMKKKTLKIVIAAAAAVLLSATTAFAAAHFLTAKDVADRIGDEAVSAAFASDGTSALEESVETGDYRITLLGTSRGFELESIEGIDADAQHEYAAVAIERLDGQPLSPLDAEPFTMLMLVDGYEPWRLSSWALGCGSTRIAENGTLYCIIDCSGIELFADHTIYLAAYDGFIPSQEIFSVDGDKHITYSDGYNGIRAMFTLPIPADRADPSAAAELLTQLGIE